jgi:hypothetical protein
LKNPTSKINGEKIGGRDGVKRRREVGAYPDPASLKGQRSIEWDAVIVVVVVSTGGVGSCRCQELGGIPRFSGLT